MKNLKPLFALPILAALVLTTALLFTSCAPLAGGNGTSSGNGGGTGTGDNPGKNLEIPLNEFTLNEEQAPTPTSPKYGSSYNQETHVLVSKGGAGLARFWPPVDGSEYNSVKIKYQVKEGCNFGTIFTIAYKVSETQHYDVAYYLPSYITEFEFPLLNDKKSEIAGFYTYTWGKPAQNTEIRFDSISLETKSLSAPTNPNYSDLPPVIDNGPQVQFDNTISAMNFIKKLGAGVNLHDYLMVNNFEQDFGLDSWTCWGQPEKITKEHIIDLKKKGFNSIRVVVSWGAHIMADDYTIDPRFMAQVKEIVDWCIEEDLYVVLDEDCSYYYPKDKDRYPRYYKGYCLYPSFEKESTQFVKAVWTQIAAAFNNSYDEHLVFEFLNEPHYDTDGYNFGLNTPEIFNVLNNLNQTIMDAIRSSGGNNANRFCVVESIGGSPANLLENNFKLPKDSAKDRIIACYHSYPMGGMGGESWSRPILTDSRLEEEQKNINELEEKYIKKGIPVLLTEFSTNQDAPVYERLKCIEGIIGSLCKKKGFAIMTTSYCDKYYDYKNLKWNEKDEACIDYFLALINETAANFNKEIYLEKYPITNDKIGKNLINEPWIIEKDTSRGFDTAELGYIANSIVITVTVEPYGEDEEHIIRIFAWDPVAQNIEGLKIQASQIKGGTPIDWDNRLRSISEPTEIKYYLNAEDINAFYEYGLQFGGGGIKITSIVIE